MTEDDRTRAMRSPGDGRPLPPRPSDGLRSGGAPAHRLPSAEPGAPTHKLPTAAQVPESPRVDEPPRSSSRVYGRARSGKSPIRPFKSRGEEPPKGPGGPVSRGGPRGPRRRLSLKAIVTIVAGFLVVLLVAALALFFVVDSRLVGIDGVLDDYEGRPADTPGTNWLLVGSDSRKGLTAAQRKKLATGQAAGQRTDSMMLLHIPEGSDKPTLVSLPRDSAVTIPGKSRDKLNSAYAIGGPKLLVRTVEAATGVHVDHYMEIGFAGFVDIVDAIGGVEINVRAAVNDPKAGLKLKKGVQTLSGSQALGYVRTRKGGALPDFERTKRQRQFLGAVVKKAASPGVLLNPFTSIPLAFSATDAVEVDSGTGAFNMLSLGLAMGDSPVTTVVPFGGNEVIPGGGTAVKWDRTKALALFDALKEDKPVPKDVVDAG
ncbi:LCP family protein [Nonomuraea gerenzanensis]|uniref:Cell envelope-associated transcriptional attenuator LytR-CpsA-Psr, subfamily A1 (As in PMID19099556) n=1 Tax=Nonomuraea gerenzanensis TaxID=93944 RepID=A0A1M4DXG1_9ACTN|nr:LCP family protein [Nonomuraea gerenzanensis]UBU13592.1 LCP family protein [Nonomuraea gerenzanensis]SBO91257.1 Cell envelope-associated transcriptional attenuator LytR-CpsA-Psr, subfamily A1 (as in PMID19099556) [Nonomuraea gerenzanensis]